MVSPTYCNQVEINTIITRAEGELVEFRYFYVHPPMPEGLDKATPFPIFPITFGPVVIMPRGLAKDMLRKFLGFMSAQDETKKDIFCPACNEVISHKKDGAKDFVRCGCNGWKEVEKPKEGTNFENAMG